MSLRHINRRDRRMPPGLSRLPFSDAVMAGNTVYISGRLGFDPATGRPPGDAEREATLLMDDLVAVLRACDLTVDALAQVTIYCPNVSLFEAFNTVYLRYFNDALPARAFIGSGPLLFDARFELTAIAIAAL